MVRSGRLRVGWLTCSSGEAAHAVVRVFVRQRRLVLPRGVQGGRTRRVLRLVPDHSHHDRSLHCGAILDVRVSQVRYLPALDAHSRRDRDTLNPTGVYSPLTHVTAGGIAGGVAAAITTPLDVCKTLLQTRGTSDDAAIRKARGMGDAFRIIRERHGLSGFARGITPRILTNMPSNALCWSVPFRRQGSADPSRLSYEGFRFLLRGRQESKAVRSRQD